MTFSDRDKREIREVRLAAAGWFAGVPVGAGIATFFADGNPYIGLGLLFGGFVLWETLRRAAGWLKA